MKILRFFGFAAVTIGSDRNSVTKLSDVIHFLIPLLIGSTFVVESIRRRDKLITNSAIVDYGNFCTYIALIVIALISMVNAFIFRHKTWSIVLILSKIDSKFSEVGFKDDYLMKGQKFGITFSLIAFQLYPLSYFMFMMEGSILKAALYLYSGFYFTLSVGSMSGAVNALNFRLTTMNTVLRSLIGDPSSKITTVRSEMETKSIADLIEIYGKMIKVKDLINLAYGIPMLLGFGLIFFYTIFTDFMLVRDLYDGSADHITIASAFFCCYLQALMYAVLYFCTVIETDAQTHLKLINAIIIKSKDKTEIAMLLCLGTLIRNNLPKFSCGLFVFDWNLVYGVR